MWYSATGQGGGTGVQRATGRGGGTGIYCNRPGRRHRRMWYSATGQGGGTWHVLQQAREAVQAYSQRYTSVPPPWPVALCGCAPSPCRAFLAVALRGPGRRQRQSWQLGGGLRLPLIRVTTCCSLLHSCCSLLMPASAMSTPVGWAAMRSPFDYLNAIARARHSSRVSE